MAAPKTESAQVVTRALPDARERWVVKSNDFIEARYGWDQMTNRLLLLAAEQVARTDGEFQPVRIPIGEYVEALGTDSKNAYERARELSANLLGMTIEIPLGDGFVEINVLSMARYRSGQGYVTIKFNDDMRPLLLQLKDRFTRYRLKSVFPIRSFAAFRIYELCKQYQGLGRRVIEMERLRHILQLDEAYPRYRDFRRRVLDQARKEINDKTDLRIGFDEIRVGLKVVAIRFLIRSVAPPAPAPRAQPALFTAEPDRDAFETWFAELSPDVQRHLRAEAIARLPEADQQRYEQARAQGRPAASLEVEILNRLRQLHREISVETDAPSP